VAVMAAAAANADGKTAATLLRLRLLLASR
jgi:hypothetical protein